jgi:hypothetical protein
MLICNGRWPTIAIVAVVLTLACVTASVNSAARAGVISVDDPVFGSGALTRDTSQGLDFLDLTFTYNYNFATVEGMMAAGQTFDGFRYATEDEVIALINNYGFIPGAVAGQQVDGTTGSHQLTGLINMLGGVYVFPTLKASGITGTSVPWDAFPDIPRRRLTTMLVFSTLPNDRVLAGTITGASRYDIGSYLVRSSTANPNGNVVPEPSTLAIWFLLTIFGVTVGWWRRKRGAG